MEHAFAARLEISGQSAEKVTPNRMNIPPDKCDPYGDKSLFKKNHLNLSNPPKRNWALAEVG